MALNNIRALWAKLRDMMAEAKRDHETVTPCHGMDVQQPVAADNGFEMREALVLVRDAINAWNAANEPIQYCQYSEVIDAIDKALAAPPRNCDKFADDESAWKAYVVEHGGESEFGEPGGPDPAEYPTWLFDTEAREGDE